MTVRLAIIGAGIMGADHAKIFSNEFSGATVSLICDKDTARAKQVADQCGALDVTTDPEATIERDDIYAVVVASPDPTHAPLTLRCIDYRKPVLCEKPLSQSPAECHEVLTAEAKFGRRWIQLGFMRRYDQSYMEMKSALVNNVLG